MIENTARKATLNELVDQFRQLLFSIEDNEGVVEDEWVDQMNGLEEGIEYKIDRCLLMVEEFHAQADVYKRRAKALGDHAKTVKKRGDWLKEYVKRSMEILEIQKMNTENFSSVRLQKSNPSVQVVDEDKLCDLYEKSDYVVKTLRPAKTEILAALKRGERIVGAELVTDNTHLRYK